MRTARRPTWFATLRRDRGLFALLGGLVMLLNVLQPLTALRASEGGPWVICTIYGSAKPVDASDLPTAWPDECPICLAGNACPVSAPAYKAVPGQEPAFPTPATVAFPPVGLDDVPKPVRRPGAPPPAMRAPPLSA